MNILVCLKMVSRATYTDMLCSDDASDDTRYQTVSYIMTYDLLS